MTNPIKGENGGEPELADAISQVPFADPTHFEWYMFKDDTSNYPMTFTLVWTFRGACHVGRWQQALNETIKTHPLTQCVMAKDPSNHNLFWKMTSIIPQIQLFDANKDQLQTECFQNWQFIDLSRECGIKAAIVSNGETWQFLLTLHHAVSDGIGAFEFSSDLFDAYEKTGWSDKGSSSASGRFAKPASVSMLTNRHDLDRSIPYSVSRWTATKFFAFELIKFVTRPAWNLAHLANCKAMAITTSHPRRHADPVLDGLQLVPIEFDESTTRKIRQVAQTNQCSQNELLIAACMSGIEKCRRSLLGNRKCWITAILPINMRRALKDRIPCHNGIGYSISRRANSQCVDVWSNANSIHAELKSVQKWSLAGLFLDTLGRIRSFPHWIQDRILRQCCPGTFVFSYVGAPIRRFPTRRTDGPTGVDLGDCQVTDFAAAPPVRRGTEIAILASMFQGRLVLWLRHSQNGLPRSVVEAIAENIREELETAIG